MNHTNSVLACISTLLAAMGSSGCGESSCNLAPNFVSPEIVVHDATTGAYICDAIMLAKCEGPTTPERFMSKPDPGGGCDYGYVYRAPDGTSMIVHPLIGGSCDLTVSKPGYTTAFLPGVTGTYNDDPCDSADPPAPLVVINLVPGT